MSAIPEVFFDGEFNGGLHFELEVDFHGFLRVNFVFLVGNLLFFTFAIDRAENSTFMYVPKS